MGRFQRTSASIAIISISCVMWYIPVNRAGHPSPTKLLTTPPQTPIPHALLVPFFQSDRGADLDLSQVGLVSHQSPDVLDSVPVCERGNAGGRAGRLGRLGEFPRVHAGENKPPAVPRRAGTSREGGARKQGRLT